MLMPLTVTDVAIAAYQEMVGYYAHRYDGFHGAEYDDLYQEGQLTVLLALQKGERPSKDIVVKEMLKWVNRCARSGISHEKYDDNSWFGYHDE